MHDTGQIAPQAPQPQHLSFWTISIIGTKIEVSEIIPTLRVEIIKKLFEICRQQAITNELLDIVSGAAAK
jgi:hypothetical protein